VTPGPFHVGCGLRVVRARVRQELHAPGLWPEPAVWERPDLIMFACPEHGLVDWSDTRYDRRYARPDHLQPPVDRRRVHVGRLERQYNRPKEGVLR
jgi:hypothetical protein